ncbi:reverse transcriptase domain-containing protein [Citrus sinensis]|nr:reverse transcriptase domain-containing protein [Citrus sinensis]
MDRLEAIRVQLGMDHALSSQSGKIWIFWSAPFSVELLHDMGQVLHCRVSHSLLPDSVLVSYIYASCLMDVREDLWVALESFADSHDLPWIVGGDFNVVQAVSEISGGHPQPQGAIDAFNLALLDFGLEDAGFVGSPFTWTNGRTWRRLDRVVCNARWSAFFSVFRVSHLNRIASDHSPLLLSWDRDTIRGPSRFKFLHVWLKHLGFFDIVRHSWDAPVIGAGMRAFQQKLVRLKLCLKVWNKDVFGNVFSQVQQAEEEVAQKERLYDISGSADDRASFSEARARLQQALLREEIFLRQQSCVRWVREGDSNTRFFHAMIRKKRQLFHIHKIRDDSSSEWITDPSAIADSAVCSFRKLQSGDSGQFQQTDFDIIPTLVTAEDDVDLCREPDIDDVRRAVFSIDPESAPGPDDFCSRGSAMPRGFQSTFLVLLPKKESPSSWVDFRPISLCNVSNKVITKVVPHSASYHLPYPERFCSRTDASLLWVLGALDFSDSESSLRPLIFGDYHLYSRYPSVRYRSAAPSDISHLSFADDIVIFANGSRCSLQRVMDFLQRYQAVSGQLISQAKSSFYIGKSAPASCRAIVHSVTSFQWRQLPFIYLGCPIFTGCLKISYFDDLVRKVRERISGWANRLLSFGGKLILIRHVLSSLPLHLFHVLRPPSTVIQSLERSFTRFLWGDSEGRRRIHWCRWPAVCFPVDEGGLGIRSFDDMAEASEIKLWWRFRQQSSLWASFMKSKEIVVSGMTAGWAHAPYIFITLQRLPRGRFLFIGRAQTLAPMAHFIYGLLGSLCGALGREMRCVCGREDETLRHLFLDCPRTRHIWGHYQRFWGCESLVLCLPVRCFSSGDVVPPPGTIFGLAGSAFGFKPPQLRGVLDSRFLEGLRVLATPRRPIRLVAWIRPSPGVVKLTVDGCSRGNPGMAASGGILRDHRGVALAAFGSFLGHKPILYAELMAICEGLELASQLGHSVLEVESDSATVVSWVLSQGPVRWDYSYIMRQACRLISSASIQVRHVLREATSAADFLANWACSHRSSRRFSSPQELPRGLLGILRTDAQSIPYGATEAMDVDDVDPLEIFSEGVISIDNKPADADFFNKFEDDFDDADIN